MNVFGDRAFGVVTKNGAPILSGWYPYKKRKRHQYSFYACTKERGQKDTAKRQLPTSQEERSHHKPTLTTP